MSNPTVQIAARTTAGIIQPVQSTVDGALRVTTGMANPLHNKVRYAYFPGTQLVKVIRFFLNENEVAHILHTYVGGIPTSNSASLLEQELVTGPFTE